MIQNITVIGAGTMGHGIAHVFARHGYPVSLYESFDSVRNTVIGQIREELSFMAEEGYIRQESVEQTLANITLFRELEPAVKDADFVIEAIPERLELKKELFAQLDQLCPAHTIFASNTSSLPLGEMIADLPEARRAHAMVCHWYNPPHLIPIAELSCFGNMDEEVFQQVYDLHVNAGKRPVKVLKDIPGLIANRMLHAMAREVFHLIEIGAASAEDIDTALKFGPGFRGATTGILEAARHGRAGCMVRLRGQPLCPAGQFQPRQRLPAGKGGARPAGTQKRRGLFPLPGTGAGNRQTGIQQTASDSAQGQPGLLIEKFRRNILWQTK